MMLVERAEAGVGDIKYLLNNYECHQCKSPYTGPPPFTGHLLVAARIYTVYYKLTC